MRVIPPVPAPARTLTGLLALLMLGVSGCGGDVAVDPHEPITESEQLYMRLALDHRAINLSTEPPYNTLQLTATPLNGDGEPVSGLPAPVFRSNDVNVQVTPEGLVTGLKAANGVFVIAELRAPGNIRHADTAVVNVNVTTSPPPTLATFSIDPVSPDSAIIPVNSFSDPFFYESWLSASILPGGVLGWGSLASRTRALTSAGDPIPNLAVEYISLDPTVATVNRRTGAVNALRPGQVRLVARTIAYGESKEATTVFRTTSPSLQKIIVTKTPLEGTYYGRSVFGPAVTIRPYGIVFWLNELNQSFDVVFDDPAAAAAPPASLCDAAVATSPDACGTGGNFTIPASPLSFWDYTGTRIRQFPNPGTYTYRDALTGATGKVVVTNDGS